MYSVIYDAKAGDVKVAVCGKLGVLGGLQFCSPKCSGTRVQPAASIGSRSELA
jgi:hypothetical protein